MIPFITVTVLANNSETPLHNFVCVQDSLFNLAWILGNSKDVIAFEVSENGQNVKPDHYGWSGFNNKWVLDFTREHFDKSAGNDYKVSALPDMMTFKSQRNIKYKYDDRKIYYDNDKLIDPCIGFYEKISENKYKFWIGKDKTRGEFWTSDWPEPFDSIERIIYHLDEYLHGR